jgi:holo-[acyl-carrier protein] synthase
MICGIGNDIVEVARFARVSPRLMSRLFSSAEQEYIAARANSPQTMGGLFAAKEAVVKALGTGFRGIWPCEVEILHDKNGRPTCTYGGHTWHISISHAAGLAAAVAVYE